MAIGETAEIEATTNCSISFREKVELLQPSLATRGLRPARRIASHTGQKRFESEGKIRVQFVISNV